MSNPPNVHHDDANLRAQLEHIVLQQSDTASEAPVDSNRFEALLSTNALCELPPGQPATKLTIEQQIVHLRKQLTESYAIFKGARDALSGISFVDFDKQLGCRSANILAAANSRLDDVDNLDFGANTAEFMTTMRQRLGDVPQLATFFRVVGGLQSGMQRMETHHKMWTDLNEDVNGAVLADRSYVEGLRKRLNSDVSAEELELAERLVDAEIEKEHTVQTNISTNCNQLSNQLENWLEKADLSHGPARGVIAPHAGYTYCGSNGGYAYRQVSPAIVNRVFILGPCHHIRLSTCALSSFTHMETPLYDLKVDTELNEELFATGKFTWVAKKADEDEHSIEMHLPYVAKVMEEFKDQFTIIPIMVGVLSLEREAEFGQILAPYLADPQNLFVISSDFCHWGDRFRYTHYVESDGPIHKSIEKLDKEGMAIIEKLEPELFAQYLRKFQNTICGRHPIGVFLQCVKALRSSGRHMDFKFLKYDQSSKCKNFDDSSVSYAAGSLIID